jgi:23S rRNA pseudouridine1911/1915/1917 synthase
VIISSTPVETVLSEGDELQEDADADPPFELREGRVPVEAHGGRLDRALAGIVPEFSRTYLQQLIESGLVRINGQTIEKASAKVKAGDRLEIELRPTPQSQAFKPEPMALDVIHEDEHLLVLVKPAGLVVHPAPGNWSGTLLNSLLAHHDGARFLPRAGIVHRLDKDTSGLLVVAKTREVMDRLVEMIAARTVSREYVAIAHGVWQGPRQQQVSHAIGRDPRNRLRMAVVDLERQSGKAALTEVSLLQNEGAYCLVRCKLQTGRTHQIRVHLASLEHPILADVTYGGKPEAGLARQALHAWRLAFDHPASGEPMAFHAPLPADLKQAMAKLGLSYNENS